MSGSGSEEEEKNAFRVVDRRRFDADGSDRDEGEIGKAVPVEPAAAPAGTSESAGPSETAGAPGADATPGTGAAPSGGATDPSDTMPGGEPNPGEPPPPTFSSLILSLSTQALFTLGEIAESPDAEPQIDLLAGKQLIDLLGVLQEKTSGNLDAGESELMERILYDLRLRFVEIARRSTARPPEN
ncbi:MAG: DUF1844 domain-containing protein [Candidatus Binatia bacterium]|nr:DUF1844 domain-containing protein [Candidatus Binatia bacterium]MDG2011578.1 DUF1844 domain-containing protein [Candidatus Binatia bacterium]